MMNYVIIIAVPAFMIVLGLGLEIALFISNVTGGPYLLRPWLEMRELILNLGFKLPQNNIFVAFKDVIPACLAVSCLYQCKMFQAGVSSIADSHKGTLSNIVTFLQSNILTFTLLNSKVASTSRNCMERIGLDFEAISGILFS